MKIAILGAGNGAHATAYLWAKAGYDVYIYDFPGFSANISEIAVAGGIFAEGAVQGFARIAYAGSDIELVLKDAEMILVVAPAYSISAFARVCKPRLKPGQTYVIMPSSGMGAVAFKHDLGLTLDDDSVVVADTSTLPFTARVIGPAKVWIYHLLPAGYKVAAIPQKMSEQVYEKLKPVNSGLEIAPSVLFTSLQNSNPVANPVIATLNAALIERTNGDFFFYDDGVTPAVGNLMKTIDEERISIGTAYGLEIESDIDIGLRQGYFKQRNYVLGYKTGAFEGLIAHPSLASRYYNEDVGYTMMNWIGLADKVGQDIPMIRSLVTLVCGIMQRNYQAESPRTLDKLGLSQFSVDELKAL